MATKLEGRGRVKALVVWATKKITFFAASLRKLTVWFWCWKNVGEETSWRLIVLGRADATLKRGFNQVRFPQIELGTARFMLAIHVTHIYCMSKKSSSSNLLYKMGQAFLVRKYCVDRILLYLYCICLSERETYAYAAAVQICGNIWNA